ICTRALIIRTYSTAAETPVPAPKQDRIHVPTLIGDVSLTVRIMFKKRSGLPRSSTRADALSPVETRADSRALRHSVARPVNWPPAASTPDPPATPPKNRYAAILLSHGAGFTTGRS